MMIITAHIENGTDVVYTENVYQHEKNVFLVFEGVELPENYKVYFSNSKERGMAVVCVGDQNGIRVPTPLLSTGEYIYAWLQLNNEGTHDTLCMVTIPVIPRPMPVYSTFGSSSATLDYEINEFEEDLHFIGITNKMAQVLNDKGGGT